MHQNQWRMATSNPVCVTDIGLARKMRKNRIKFISFEGRSFCNYYKRMFSIKHWKEKSRLGAEKWNSTRAATAMNHNQFTTVDAGKREREIDWEKKSGNVRNHISPFMHATSMSCILIEWIWLGRAAHSLTQCAAIGPLFIHFRLLLHTNEPTTRTPRTPTDVVRMQYFCHVHPART